MNAFTPEDTLKPHMKNENLDTEVRKPSHTMRNLTTDHIFLLPSSFFLLPSSFFLLPSSFTQAAESHPDGTLFCGHPYLTPSNNGTMCVLPGRIDVGRHLILTGGARGLREPYVRTRRRGRDEGGTTEG